MRQYDADRLIVDLPAQMIEDRSQVLRSTGGGRIDDALVRCAVDPDLHRCRAARLNEVDEILRRRRPHSLDRLCNLFKRAPASK